MMRKILSIHPLGFQGQPLSSGVCFSRHVVFWQEPDFTSLVVPKLSEFTLEQEVDRYRFALDSLIAEIKHERENATVKDIRDLLEFQIQTLEGTRFEPDKIRKVLRDSDPLQSAEFAAHSIVRGLYAFFSAQDDPGFSKMAPEMASIGRALLSKMGVEMPTLASKLDGDHKYVVITPEFAPDNIRLLASGKIAGVVTQKNNATDHAVVVAGERMIPMIKVDSLASYSEGRDVENIYLEASQKSGEAFINIPIERREHYIEKQKRFLQAVKEVISKMRAPSVTSDGVPFKAFMNVGSAAHHPIGDFVDGIGLVRTELVLMSSDLNKDVEPSKDDQADLYHSIFEEYPNKNPVFRLLDIAPDKPIPYLKIKGRGFSRIWQDSENARVYRHQVEAILQAAIRSKVSEVSMMVPMIETEEDVQQAIQMIETIADRLRKNHEAVPRIRFGVMVETRQSVLEYSKLLKHVDFISVGTNDLFSETLLESRFSGDETKLTLPAFRFNPAKLAILQYLIQKAKEKNVDIGICGEVAGNEEWAALLIGAGATYVSASASNLIKVKDFLRQTEIKTYQGLMKKLLNLPESKLFLETITGVDELPNDSQRLAEWVATAYELMEADGTKNESFLSLAHHAHIAIEDVIQTIAQDELLSLSGQDSSFRGHSNR